MEGFAPPLRTNYWLGFQTPTPGWVLLVLPSGVEEDVDQGQNILACVPLPEDKKSAI